MTFWQRLTARFGTRRLLRFIRFYPPYIGAGVRVTAFHPALRWIDVDMRLRWWNRNYMGTHFGGSLYAMCDPFPALMVMHAIGRGYIVWDKSASITFVRPGRGRVKARFELSDEQVERICRDADLDGKAHPRFEILVRNEAGETVARVEKVLSVKKRHPPALAPHAAAR